MMNASVDQALRKLKQLYSRPMPEFRDAIIEEMCRVTGSSIAYFYYADLTEQYLTLMGYSKSVMESCQIIDKPAVYRVDETGLWGDAVRQRQAVITNDYRNSKVPSKRGYPKGHVEVRNHMNLPIFEDGRIVAVVGVGNKVGNYTQDDVETLEYLMTHVWQQFKHAFWQHV